MHRQSCKPEYEYEARKDICRRWSERLSRMEFRIQNGNGNVVAARDKGNGNRKNGNQVRYYNCRGMGHIVRNCTVRPRRRDVVIFRLVADCSMGRSRDPTQARV
ncbi:retrovirus-related pol polyprotein from transposon TNT 1-94 [Tanacetum coccineum]|uniref:Retrovirus-related pol polyprotein from transposon TNT 1-94 n=1 Tax=Tanacetum coccineum TaxID=301880 RepID=A0ABQ4XQN3_9ASTR